MVKILGPIEPVNQGWVMPLAIAQEVATHMHAVNFAGQIHQARLDHSRSQECRDLGLAGRATKIGYYPEEHPNGLIVLFVDLVH